MSKIEDKLIEEFKDKKFFSRKELFRFYHSFEPQLKEGSFGWKIHNLKSKNLIKSLKRGLYTISDKPEYKPDISFKLLKIIALLSSKLDEVKYCIWESAWLNEFVQHQISKSSVFIEVEKGFEEYLFYFLRDNSFKEVFVKPDEKVIDLYIAESEQPVIIKRLPTRSPMVKRTGGNTKFYTPSLEKILVDIFAEERLFYFLHGSELLHIYENALSKYTINFTKLFSYAKRRGKEQDIKQFMTNHIPHLVKDIIDD